MAIKKREQIHNYLVQEAFNKPHILGHTPNLVIAKVKEYELYLREALYVKPDLYIQTFETDYYYEIKSVNSNRTKNKGRMQIARVRQWLGHYKIQKPSEVILLIPDRNRNDVRLEDLIVEATR